MENFIEIKNWGLNPLILSSLATFLFTLLQGYGFLKQGQKIWLNQSAQSLSVVYFFLSFFYFISFVFYGFSKNSLAMIFNGFLFLPCLPIVIGIFKFKKLNLLETFFIMVMFLGVVPIMIWLKEKEIFLFILLMIILVTLATQPIVMIKEKSRGVVEIKFVYSFLATSTFWFVYSSIMKEWALQIFNVAAILVYLVIIFLYRKYRP